MGMNALLLTGGPGQWGTLTSCMCAIDILVGFNTPRRLYIIPASIQAIFAIFVHVPAIPTATWRDKSFFNELTSDNLNWNERSD